jgi:hypothetical protein
MTSDERRARALLAEHDPRTGKFGSKYEGQLSRHDEQTMTDHVRISEERAGRAELIDLLGKMTTDLQRVQALIGRVAPSDHRGYLRSIRHGLEGLIRAIDK